MMANAWRDPAWRGAFFLLTRLTATDGNCDIPPPPDGTERAELNPFANDDCSSTFDIGTGKHTTRGSGSLLDGFCSRCHMPSNYIDAVKQGNVTYDQKTGLEHGLIDPSFDPASARGTPFAFATAESELRNTESGKLGISCTFCHTISDTRYTPFHNLEISGQQYTPAASRAPRAVQLASDQQESFVESDPSSPNLGYAVGAGAYRISPEALAQPERFGPLSDRDRSGDTDPYVSGVFEQALSYQHSTFEGSIHKGNYNVYFERAEMCAACHDVTNPLTIKNRLGMWVGGFPIERTYSEWASSRYAERPGNANFNPTFKRDCQTCHMQQHFGNAGTAQALYTDAGPVPPLTGKSASTGPERPVYYSHHFVGGNTYSTRLVGADSDSQGKARPYPELSVFSFSSADPDSKYYGAYFEGAVDSGPPTHQVRMAWDRLRNALDVDLKVSEQASPGENVAVHIRVVNTGTGHNFPTGFPEGRNAWVALRAIDVGTGDELQIEDDFWHRRSLGVGYLTDHDMQDPNFPDCDWKVPAGGPDPYAWQFRAVASLGDGCPTLELPYAAPLNLEINGQGLPIDDEGNVIGRDNPLALPRFKDLDEDGDIYDDAFLLDNRLRPLPHPGATLVLDRYSVAIPADAVGPIAVTTAVYYQSMEAVVAKKLLGNLADTDMDHVLEPCVLRGPCDGRVPHTEPAVVEGAPPVPMRVETRVIRVEGSVDSRPPEVSVYPSRYETNAYTDSVIKVTTSEPVKGVDATSFRLLNQSGTEVSAAVAQIDDFTWALFPDQIFLVEGESYYAELTGPICDFSDNCAYRNVMWSFKVAEPGSVASADTRPPSRPAPILELPSLISTKSTRWTMDRWLTVLMVLTSALLLFATWLRARAQLPADAAANTGS